MKISVVTPTFNEIENIEKIYFDLKNQLEKIKCDYEHLIMIIIQLMELLIKLNN